MYCVFLRYDVDEAKEAGKEPPPLPRGSSVTLQPGDTLYIPPYWHFRSQAEALSLTLAVNSPTAAEAFLAEAAAQPTPLFLFAEHSDKGDTDYRL
jgi:hypothetical protein